MTLVSVSDNFNRANGPLNVSGGNWVSNVIATDRPLITSNTVYSGNDPTGTPAVGVAVWKDRNAGIQTSQITMTTITTSQTERGGVIVAAEDTASIPGQFYNWLGNGAMYILRARTTLYRLEKKSNGTSSVTQIGSSYNTAPANGDVIKITFDPATGEIKGYVNDMVTPKITYTDTEPLSTQSGVGFILNAGGYADDWSGSWETSDSLVTKSGTDTTNISSADSGSKSTSSPVLNVSDNFNRANGWIGGSTSKWVCATISSPIITSNQATSATSGTAVYLDSYSGKQTSQFTLVSSGTGASKGAVMVGVENATNSTNPATFFAWYGTGPFYRFNVRDSSFILQVKASGGSGQTTLDTYTPPAGVQPGDVVGMTYDPSNGNVECFVNGTRVINRTDLAPLTGDHSRIGFYVESGTIIDNWQGSWTTSELPADGWRFYEWSGGVEIPLFPTLWSGGVEIPILMDQTSIVEAPVSTLPQVQPLHSDVVVDKFSVNMLFNNSADSVYDTNRTAMINLAVPLGIRHIRCRLFQADVGSASKMNFVDPMAAAGIRTSANMGNSSLVINTWTAADKNSAINAVLDWINTHKYFVDNVAGLNEPNDQAATDWATKTVDWQQRIYDNFMSRGFYDYIHNDAYAARMFVQGPALKDQDDTTPWPITPLESGAFVTLGNLGISNYMHIGDLHRYPLQNRQPYNAANTEANATWPENLADRINAAAQMAGGKPTSYTEYGFVSEPPPNTGSNAMDEQAASVYHARMLLYHTTLPNINRFHAFQLCASPSSASDFGLVHPTTFAPKQSYNTIKSLLTLFADSGPAYTPPKFGLRLTYTENPVTLGTPNDGGLKSIVLAKRNGTKYVILWRLTRIWSRVQRARLNPASMNVTVETDASTQTVPVSGFPILVTINSTNTITGITNLTPTW